WQPDSPAELTSISTEWSLVFDPIHFVERYARAIHRYLLALTKNQDDADEAAQEFFLRVTKHGFGRAKRERGRFRDYLKVAVRNWAFSFMKRRRPFRSSGVDWSHVPTPQWSSSTAEREWLAEWRQCLLNRAWHQLEARQDPGAKACCTVLRVASANPGAHSKALAARAGQLLGRPIRADAFRKQLSRARRVFAKFLVREIAQ